MKRSTDWLTLTVAMLLFSVIAAFGARAQAADRPIKTQEPRNAASSEGHAVISTHAGHLGVLVRGIHSARLAQLLGNASDSPSGWRDGFDAGGSVALGSELARQLSVGVGDSITLVAPHGTTSASKAPHIKAYRIDAILPHGVTPLDAVLVLMAVSQAGSYSDR
jgi:lipoprotein-releasing system permease protein